MESFSNLVRVTLPNYLRTLPIPASISGFAQLSGQEWLQLAPFVGTVSLLVYVTVESILANLGKSGSKVAINSLIEKDKAKVVHIHDIEDLGDKVAYCRCWKSKKFPLCDGSHGKHNEECGDNVGPLVLKRKEAK